MKTNLKKSALFIATIAMAVMFNVNAQAAGNNGTDTTKMAKKMGKIDKMKKDDKMKMDDKMSKGKMKMKKDSSKMKM
jgi:hypothetical protein